MSTGMRITGKYRNCYKMVLNEDGTPKSERVYFKSATSSNQRGYSNVGYYMCMACNRTFLSHSITRHTATRAHKENWEVWNLQNGTNGYEMPEHIAITHQTRRGGLKPNGSGLDDFNGMSSPSLAMQNNFHLPNESGLYEDPYNDYEEEGEYRSDQDSLATSIMEFDPNVDYFESASSEQPFNSPQKSAQTESEKSKNGTTTTDSPCSSASVSNKNFQQAPTGQEVQDAPTSTSTDQPRNPSKRKPNPRCTIQHLLNGKRMLLAAEAKNADGSSTNGDYHDEVEESPVKHEQFNEAPEANGSYTSDYGSSSTAESAKLRARVHQLELELKKKQGVIEAHAAELERLRTREKELVAQVELKNKMLNALINVVS